MKTLAVHIHLYYKEQLPKVLGYLKNLSYTDYDLFVTIPYKDEDLVDEIHSFYPKSQVWVVPNLGYDIGPFVDFLHRINLSDYDYVLKCHTKGKDNNTLTLINHRYLSSKVWGNILWDSLLRNDRHLHKCLSLLKSESNIGMLGSCYLLTNEKYTYEHLLPQINDELQKMGFTPTDKVTFIAGTMFFVKSSLLKPFLQYKITDFSPSEKDVKDGTLAHVCERLLGAIVEKQGYRILPVSHGIYISTFLKGFRRFLFQKKMTHHRTIIKICKVPIYFKKRRGV